jgi:DNA-binding NarL/FixJ family response regulator
MSAKRDHGIYANDEQLKGDGIKVETNTAVDSPGKNESKISVLLVDDHQIVRKGLAVLLQKQHDLEVVGEADDGRSAVELVRKLKPDVVVMDLGLPELSGFEATKRIVAENPDVRVVGLSAHENQEFADEMCKAGAVTYVGKSEPAENLIAAIHACKRPAI